MRNKRSKLLALELGKPFRKKVLDGEPRNQTVSYEAAHFGEEHSVIFSRNQLEKLGREAKQTKEEVNQGMGVPKGKQFLQVPIHWIGVPAASSPCLSRFQIRGSGKLTRRYGKEYMHTNALSSMSFQTSLPVNHESQNLRHKQRNDKHQLTLEEKRWELRARHTQFESMSIVGRDLATCAHRRSLAGEVPFRVLPRHLPVGRVVFQVR